HATADHRETAAQIAGARRKPGDTKMKLRVFVPTLFTALAAQVVTVVTPAALLAQGAQGGAQDPIPQIFTTGTGEAQVTPDRARIDVAVETRGPTAAAASTENARITTAVLARVKALGITDQQLSSWGYNVHPEYDYSRPEGRPRIIGYIARNTVRV